MSVSVHGCTVRAPKATSTHTIIIHTCTQVHYKHACITHECAYLWYSCCVYELVIECMGKRAGFCRTPNTLATQKERGVRTPSTHVMGTRSKFPHVIKHQCASTDMPVVLLLPV